MVLFAVYRADLVVTTLGLSMSNANCQVYVLVVCNSDGITLRSVVVALVVTAFGCWLICKRTLPI